MMDAKSAESRYADEMLAVAVDAARRMEAFTQAEVDRIVEAAFRAAYENRIDLARMAHEETGIGVFEHKVLKNAWASLRVYEEIRDRRTVGVLSEDPVTGIAEIARPSGPILATIPLTNPTSTAIFKTLICLKTRNPLIFSPHRAARKCVRRTVEILDEAARAAGAPDGAVRMHTRPQKEYLESLMAHRSLALILATGTGSIVRTAQRSGTPTYGVGPGNVPVYIDRTADLASAVRELVHSKTFDNGTVCASEQALVVTEEIDPVVRMLLAERGGWFCPPKMLGPLGEVAFDPESRSMRPEVVGRSAAWIAERCGFRVPDGSRLLIAEPKGIGRDHPLSHEILAPILAYYAVPTYEDAVAACSELNRLGGDGHTVGVYANDERIVEEFARRMRAGRICVNHPTTHGAIGGIYNNLPSSLTLSCGTEAGNITADNITIDHLIQVHRIVRRRECKGWMKIPRETFLDPRVGAESIRDLYNRNR